MNSDRDKAPAHLNFLPEGIAPLIRTRLQPGDERAEGTKRFRPFPGPAVVARGGQAVETASVGLLSALGAVAGVNELLPEIEMRPGGSSSWLE